MVLWRNGARISALLHYRECPEFGDSILNPHCFPRTNRPRAAGVFKSCNPASPPQALGNQPGSNICPMSQGQMRGRSAWLPFALARQQSGVRSKPLTHVGVRSRADSPTTALRWRLRSKYVAFMGGGVKADDMTVGVSGSEPQHLSNVQLGFLRHPNLRPFTVLQSEELSFCTRLSE
jgi:hypothetical protein